MTQLRDPSPRVYNELTGLWATERVHRLVRLLPVVWRAHFALAVGALALTYTGALSFWWSAALWVSLGLIYGTTRHLDERR